MSTFRVVWEYTENTGATFNEVYYRDAGTPAEATAVTDGLLNARLSLMHPLNRLLAIRVSQADGNRITANRSINLPGTAELGSGSDDGPCTPGEAIVCTLNAAPAGSRKIWMRGCPDVYIKRFGTSGRDYLASGVEDRLKTWFQRLAGNSYGMRPLLPQTPGPLQNRKILQVDGSVGDGTSLVTLASVPGYPFPGRVIIGAASKKDLPALNGRWQIMEAVGGAIVKIPYQTPQANIIVGGNAKMRQESYGPTSPFVAANCGFSHFGTRTTKNPLTHSRGARRAVRIRTSL